MDIKDIKKIIELMKNNDLSEFELEEDNFRIAIKRRNGIEQVVMSPPGAPSVVVPMAAPAAAAQPAASTQPGTAPAAAPSPEDNLPRITSPMVGTFYRSASPETASFVNVGDSVDEESVVCIIEAMKVMNEIKAEMKGVVKKILVENAETVEFGQPLFVVEPA